MRAESGRRLGIVFIVAGLCLLVLIARAVQFAILEHDELRRLAEAQQTEQIDLPGRRGPLLDRHGRTLACTLENPSLALRLAPECDRGQILTASLRAGACTRTRAREIEAAQTAGFFWLKRGWVSEGELRRLPTELPQLERIREMKRFYPLGPLAAPLLGLVGTDGRGLSGLEWRYDDHLAGTPGRLLQFVTGAGRPHNAPPAQVLREPEPGGGLLLTIDRQIQEIARYHLLDGMAAAEATEGFVVILDPWTGALLALVAAPSFDPLAKEEIATERLQVAPVMYQFEPGSIFKIVALCAGLESGRVSVADSFDCCNGKRRIGREVIHDLKKFGVITADEILIFSSNIGAGLIAEECGWARICDMTQAFGFGQPTGIELGGEASGYVPHPRRPGWSDRTLATMAYGQEVACTGLQMALAFGVIANGGWLMKPLLVSARLDPEGRVVDRIGPEVVRRVITPETAETMTALLRRVVTEGTGGAAEVAAFPPAGKTGTAQLIDPVTRRYSADEHVLSFAGFAPYDNPRCVCLVSLRTRTDAHAGSVAGPVFAGIVRDLVWILGEDRWPIQALAEPEGAPVIVPDVRGLAPQAARRAVRRLGLLPVLDGLGTRVTGVQPAPYGLVPAGSVIRLSLGDETPRGTVKVPGVRQLSLRRALAVLSEAGLAVSVSGCGWVTDQSPAAGQEVDPGSCCRLTAGPGRARARANALRRRDLVCRFASADGADSR